MPPLYGEVRRTLISEINEATKAQHLFVALAPLISAFGLLIPWKVERAVVLAIAVGFIAGTLVFVWRAQRLVRYWATRLDEIASEHGLPTISPHPYERQTTRVLLFLAVQLLVDAAFIAWLATA